MKTSTRVALLIMLVFGVGQAAFADGSTRLITSTFTIPAVLELAFPEASPVLQLTGAPGQPVVAQCTLRVGTNDWPLDLHLGIPADAAIPAAFQPLYRFVESDASSALWVSMPVFSDSMAVAQLASPAWTNYTLAVRLTIPEDAAVGVYSWRLRVLFHSRSGQVEEVAIPVSLVIE